MLQRLLGVVPVPTIDFTRSGQLFGWVGGFCFAKTPFDTYDLSNSESFPQLSVGKDLFFEKLRNFTDPQPPLAMYAGYHCMKTWICLRCVEKAK